MIYGLCHGAAAPLEALLREPKVDDVVKWSALVAVAWLGRDGRMSRESAVDLVDRFEREAMADVDSLAWAGWQEAVLILGLFEFEARARDGWRAGRLAHDREIDRRDWLDRLAQARANPEAPGAWLEALTPPDDRTGDPTWLKVVTERGLAAGDPDGPLKAEEVGWLAGFMESRHWPDGAAGLEEADGHFAALLAGPDVPDVAHAIEALWRDGDEPGAPDWGDAAQEAYVRSLFTRRWSTLRDDLAAGRLIEPLGWFHEPGLGVRAWASGFALAVANRREAWEPLFQDATAAVLLQGILGLATAGPARKPRERKEQANLGQLVPGMVRLIHAFWHAPDVFGQLRPAARLPKVGRNDACPCGSGRKSKKCCAAAGPPQTPATLPWTASP